MRLLNSAALAVITVLLVAPGVLAGALTVPAGYYGTDTPLSMPAGAWFGGFDVLPDGDFVYFDGYGLTRVTPAGEEIGSLYTFPSYVYGSFVKYNPSNDRIYFAESSNNGVYSIPAAGGVAHEIAVLPGSYDLAFWGDNCYVVAMNTIYLLDESTGATDAIASAGSASGPLTFDFDGNLIYGPGNPNWPPTTNDQSIYLWSAAQVAGAVGPGVLSTDEAALLAENCDAPAGFALDTTGELLFTDSQVSPGVLRVLRNGVGEVLATTQSPVGAPWITTLRYNPAVDGFSAAVSWTDEYWNTYTTIATIGRTAPVPEPSSWAMLVTALASCAGLKWRRRV